MTDTASPSPVSVAPAPSAAAAPAVGGRTLICIATYNEKQNLLPLIDQIHAVLADADVLVVDDASPDGTGDLADRRAGADARVHVMHRAGKLGLGSALLDAVRYSIEHDYDYMIVMDADFSHHPRYLPALRGAMSSGAQDGIVTVPPEGPFDVVIGSRYIPGGGVEGWNWKRRFMSWGINVYSRALLGLTARDTSGGFRCYRVGKLAEIDRDRILSRGYSFQEEFLHHCKRVGCRIGETPIVFENRRHGESKISAVESVKALWCLLRASLRRG